MRLLIVHHEAEYFAGAEKVLGYFLEGLIPTRMDITVAAVRESRVREVIPAGVKTCWLPENNKFSIQQLRRQVAGITALHRNTPFDLIHGWAARDWELTALAGWLTHRPAVGTLHDHPRAPFISRARQRLMAWSAAVGLRKVVCVSNAVREACIAAGYRPEKLVTVHNGLPLLPASPPAGPGPRFRIGFLGMFSERKGLRGIFHILEHLAASTQAPWELALAGDAQEADGRRLVEEIKAQYVSKSWWPKVQWCGWVKRPMDFLASLDLLICPSSEFDPFPTVLLEAGQAGLAILGARVGGVPEIIEDGKTGWLFDAQAWDKAALQLKALVESPALARQAGRAAQARGQEQFTVGRMVEGYRKVYAGILGTEKL